MKTAEFLLEKYTCLRRRAEERIKKWSKSESPGEADLHQVIHELKIHLAEQEIRNEELKQEMETRRLEDEARYESVRGMFRPHN